MQIEEAGEEMTTSRGVKSKDDEMMKGRDKCKGNDREMKDKI